MKLADDVAHRARRFLVLRAGGQTQFAHRIDDAPLHRFQAIAEMRQCAIQYDVHRVIEISTLGERLQRLLLDPVEIQLLCFHTAYTCAMLPLLSNHTRRSPARFFASSMSSSESGLSAASMVICTKRRVCGAMVVSRN
jgi:hypothetical protein